MSEPYVRVLNIQHVISNLLLARLSQYVHDEDERRKLHRDSDDKINTELVKIERLHSHYQLPNELKAQYAQCVLAYRRKKQQELEQHFFNLLTREQKCLLSFNHIKAEYLRHMPLSEFVSMHAKYQSQINQLRNEFVQRIVQWIMYGNDNDMTHLRDLLAECDFRLGSENVNPDILRKEIYAVMAHEIETCVLNGIPYLERTIQSPRLILYCECNPSPRLGAALIPHGQEFAFLLGENPADMEDNPSLLFLNAKNPEASNRAETLLAKKILCINLLVGKKYTASPPAVASLMRDYDLAKIKSLYRIFYQSDKTYNQEIDQARKILRHGINDCDQKISLEFNTWGSIDKWLHSFRWIHLFSSVEEFQLLQEEVPLRHPRIVFNWNFHNPSRIPLTFRQKSLKNTMFMRTVSSPGFSDQSATPLTLHFVDSYLTNIIFGMRIQTIFQDCTLTNISFQTAADMVTPQTFFENCCLIKFNNEAETKLLNYLCKHDNIICATDKLPIIEVLKQCDAKTLHQSAGNLLLEQFERICGIASTASNENINSCTKVLFKFTSEFFSTVFATPHAAVIIDPIISVLNDVLERKQLAYKFLLPSALFSKLFASSQNWPIFIEIFAAALFKSIQVAHEKGEIQSPIDARTARFMLQRAQCEGQLKDDYVTRLNQLVGASQALTLPSAPSVPPAPPLLPPNQRGAELPEQQEVDENNNHAPQATRSDSDERAIARPSLQPG